jgi:hypothetical protein
VRTTLSFSSTLERNPESNQVPKAWRTPAFLASKLKLEVMRYKKLETLKKTNGNIREEHQHRLCACQCGTLEEHRT